MELQTCHTCAYVKGIFLSTYIIASYAKKAINHVCINIAA